VAGAILPLGGLTKIDLRGGLNYLTANAENHSGFGGLRYSDGEIDQFSGVISAHLFTSWNCGPTVVRPFVQGGVDYRFHYENEIRIDDQKVSFEEGRTTVFGRAGVDFDIGNRSQVYFAIRGDHNDDFDTIAGQAGLTIRLN
jgi:outer membrane autotransporter protein